MKKIKKIFQSRFCWAVGNFLTVSIAKNGICDIMKETKGGEDMTVHTRIQKNTTSLAGKVVAISGSTGGLGHALCMQLAALGAQLILLDRNQEKVNALCAHIRREFPQCKVGYVLMDLAKMESVDMAADILQKKQREQKNLLCMMAKLLYLKKLQPKNNLLTY